MPLGHLYLGGENGREEKNDQLGDFKPEKMRGQGSAGEEQDRHASEAVKNQLLRELLPEGVKPSASEETD